MNRRVVVTGLGHVSAAGIGIGEAWERMRTDPPVPRPFAGPPPVDGIRFPAYQAPAYELGDLGVPARCLRWLSGEGLAEERDLGHLLGATGLALRDAGLGVETVADLTAFDPAAAVVVADESPGFDGLSRELFGLGLDGRPIPDDPVARYDAFTGRFFRLSTFLLPHYLARAFRFEGLALFVNSACTSGLNALDVAAQQVLSGRSRIAVAAGADDPLSAAKYLWAERLGLYADDGRLRPFDAGQRGTLFGDGGAAVVLEERESALARGARIYAEPVGSGFAQDGWKITVPSPTALRAADALARAFAEAGIGAGEVDLLVPHGVGTAASDGYEAMVLHRVFGEDTAAWPAVAALKPYVGHNLGGCALVELTLMLAAMAHGAVPPTPVHELPHVPYARRPVPLAREWRERPIGVAVKLTCGFAGYYGASVFRRTGDTGDAG